MELIKIDKYLFNYLVVILIFCLLGCSGGEKKSSENVQEDIDSLAHLDSIAEAVVHVPLVKFGFLLDTFVVVNDTVKSGETLSHLLLPHNVSQFTINESVRRFKDVFSLKKINRGNPYTVLKKNDSVAQYFIYEIDRVNYVVLDLNDTLNLYLEKKEVEIRDHYVNGLIANGSSFSQALDDSLKNIRLSAELVDEITQLFAWTIDFFSLRPSDYYSVIFDEKFVEDEWAGLNSIKGIHFHNNGVDYYGIPFKQNGKISFFDEEGKSLKKQFLKAPLKYSRISSGFTSKRFHPVQKRFKAHLGTDYAARRGTPIWSVGDGTVVEAKYSRFNGNYVKIRHNHIITTQYLHMTKIAKGIRPGVRVRQKQTIGYVGSTGLASGPHVCFRYWKNGRQINHRREKFESSEPINKENITSFDEVKNVVLGRLALITVKEPAL